MTVPAGEDKIRITRTLTWTYEHPVSRYNTKEEPASADDAVEYEEGLDEDSIFEMMEDLDVDDVYKLDVNVKVIKAEDQ